MEKRTLLIGIFMVIASGPTFSTESKIDECIAHAANHYQVNAQLIEAIIQTESAFDPNAVGRNNGSRDIGLMQINTEWLPRIKPFGITEKKLFEPCTNIWVGVWILAQEIQRFGNAWEAVGAYNAGPSPKRQAIRIQYAQRVYRNWTQ